MIGYSIVSAKYITSDPNHFVYSSTRGSGVGFGLFVGGRYMFNKEFGGFAEIGYGASYLNLGISYKF